MTKEYVCLLVITALFTCHHTLHSSNEKCSKTSSGVTCIGISGKLPITGEDVGALFIYHSDLSHLTSDDFSSFNDLFILDINNCSFGEVDVRDVFKHVQTLGQLQIRFSDISGRIISIVAANKGLTEVRLNSNNIMKVCGVELSNLKHISILDLSNNTISEIIVNYAENICNVDEFAKSFCDLNELQHLLLRYNVIQRLRGYTFGSMPKLRRLDLSHNNISEIEPNTFNLQDKGTVKINEVLLNISFNNLSVLRNLTFAGCDIITILDLFNNRIRLMEIGAFSHLTSLQHLNISTNRLNALQPRVFFPLKELLVLDISRNQLTVLEDYTFRNNAKLEVLDLSDNSLGWLPCHAFFGLRALRTLRLGAGNRLRSLLYVHIAPLHGLRGLSLRLPPGSLCECAAFKELQTQNVLLELGPGTKEKSCFDFSEKLRNNDEFGVDCVHFYPQPECRWNKSEYFEFLRRRSSVNPWPEPSRFPLSTIGTPTASMATLETSPLQHRDTSPQTRISTQPPHSTSTTTSESDFTIMYSPLANTNFLPSTTTLSTLLPTEYSHSSNDNSETMPNSKPFNVTENVSVSQNVSYRTQHNLDLTSDASTTNGDGRTIRITQKILESSSSRVKKEISSTSLSPSIEIFLMSVISILLLLSGGVICVFVYKLFVRCRLKALEWSHDYEEVRVDESHVRYWNRNETPVDDSEYERVSIPGV